MCAFHFAYVSCRSCWLDPNTYYVVYDGLNMTNWLAISTSTTGLGIYTYYPTVQAYLKGGQGGNAKQNVVTGNMIGLQSWQ